jgi:hypothetical protein
VFPQALVIEPNQTPVRVLVTRTVSGSGRTKAQANSEEKFHDR